MDGRVSGKGGAAMHVRQVIRALSLRKRKAGKKEETKRQMKQQTQQKQTPPPTSKEEFKLEEMVFSEVEI